MENGSQIFVFSKSFHFPWIMERIFCNDMEISIDSHEMCQSLIYHKKPTMRVDEYTSPMDPMGIYIYMYTCPTPQSHGKFLLGPSGTTSTTFTSR